MKTLRLLTFCYFFYDGHFAGATQAMDKLMESMTHVSCAAHALGCQQAIQYAAENKFIDRAQYKSLVKSCIQQNKDYCAWLKKETLTIKEGK